jgi:hypothetical protein
MAAWKGIVGKGFRSDDFRQYVDGVTFASWRPQFVVVHNTSAPRLSQWHSTPGAQRMFNLQSYYRDHMKWSAGPHLFVADDLIWVFTPLTTSGVHSPSWNAISWGVEIVGEYQEEAFGDAIRSNTVEALATLHGKLGLDPQHLRFHKEDPLTTHKTCPGKNVVKPDLIAAVQQRLASLNPGEHLQAPPGDVVPGISDGSPSRTTTVSYGWKPDLPDHRDFSYATMRLGLEAPASLPSSVDLRLNCPPVYMQGPSQSCTANALAAAFKFLEIKSKNATFEPSRMFIYYNERDLESDTDSDAGAYLRDGIKCIATNGICDETNWPYSELFSTKPSQSCYDQALTYKAVNYYRLNNANLNELQSCLAAGFPFVFGFSIYSSFQSVGDSNGGNVPIPEAGESVLGGHAVMAVGYDDATSRFVIQNSWGPAVGDRGFYYMPYNYLTSTNLCDDFWTIRAISTAPQAAVAAPFELPSAELTSPPVKAPVGLAKDMETAKQYAAYIKEAATKYNLSPSLICALGSRESGWGLGSDMKPKGPAGTGDWAPRGPSRYGYAMPPDGLGWGRGLLQIDYQQAFAQTGNWQDPEANILYGCAELAGNIAYFMKNRAGQSYDPQRAGIAAYNCGRGNVTKAIKAGFDVDHYTAGNNYSQDFMNRMKWFQQDEPHEVVPAGRVRSIRQSASGACGGCGRANDHRANRASLSGDGDIELARAAIRHQCDDRRPIRPARVQQCQRDGGRCNAGCDRGLERAGDDRATRLASQQRHRFGKGSRHGELRSL